MTQFFIIDHLFFFIIAILLPGLSLLRGKIPMENIKIENKAAFYYSNGAVLWAGAVIVGVIWLVSGRPWIQLGIRPPILSPLVIALTLLFITTYLIETFNELNKVEITKETMDSIPFLPSTWREFGHFSFLAISAGICEEVVYRGFLVNYLYASFRDPVVAYNMAVILPAFLFGLVHLYQGKKAVLKIMVMSLLFGTIYIFSESLLIVILLHTGVDLAGGIMGLTFNRRLNNKQAIMNVEEEE